jgi:hypothetical protein
VVVFEWCPDTFAQILDDAMGSATGDLELFDQVAGVWKSPGLDPAMKPPYPLELLAIRHLPFPP